MKPVQYFDDDYLLQCKKFSDSAILEYLENFRLMQNPVNMKSKLISIKIPEFLLQSFKKKAELNNIKYQTQIKKLMRDWVLSGSGDN